MSNDNIVLFFDLFFTLITPHYKDDLNEYDVLGISVEEWEMIAENNELYFKRATGSIIDEVQIIDEIIAKGGYHVTADEKKEIIRRRTDRMHHALLNIDKTIFYTLERLKNLNIKLCLISNADVIDKKHWIDSPLSSLFDVSVFSCDVGYMKPQPDIYRIAMSKINTVPQKSCFIGDGGSDELQGAKKEGMTTVLTEHLLKREPQTLSELLVYTDYHITNFSNLLELPIFRTV